MRRKVFVGMMMVSMVLGLVACSSSKKSSKVEEFFTAFENTIKSDSYGFDFSMYEADGENAPDAEYVGRFAYVRDNDEVYFGYKGGEMVERINNKDYQYLFCNDGMFCNDATLCNHDFKDKHFIDMTDDHNKYESEGSSQWETEQYYIYKIFNFISDKDVDGFMSNVSKFETSVGIPVYREYKQAIPQVIELYEDNKNNISFIKNLEIEDNTLNLTMYAYDFYCWCNKNIDSYTISEEWKEADQDIKDIPLNISITVENGKVTKYAYYHDWDGKKDGVILEFNDIDKLGKDVEVVSQCNKIIEEKKPGDYKDAMCKTIKKMEEEKREYKYKINEETDSEDNKYPQLWVSADYGCFAYSYDGYEYVRQQSEFYEDTFEDYYTAEEMLDYLENGTALPEVAAWKKAYIKYLSSHESEIGGCELAYLNDDEIPELFVHTEESPSHGSGAKIFTVEDGEVKQVGDREYGSSGCVGVFEKEGIILSEFCGMGEVDSCYYRLNEENSLEEIVHLLITDADLPENSKYYIDNVEVTEKQWEKKCEEVEPDNVEKKWVVSEPLTANEMSEKIAGMK